jgi:DNA (cytosine-5)-methyltransferase 1
VYYNEIDRYCCDWLSNLMDAGHIASGRIDDRSIADISPDDVRGYERCHFFAGIAGWELALNLAGWRGPVWTGSCPCQPFSAAGKGKTADDERHLWPTWFSLIRECKPARVLGEQVEAAIGWGWLDAVFADLEAESYACGAAVLPACGVGAPHIRQRVWFCGSLGDANCSEANPSEQRQSLPSQGCFNGELGDAQYHGLRRHTGAGNSEKDERQEKGQKTGDSKYNSADTGSIGELADADASGRQARLSPGRLSEGGTGASLDTPGPWDNPDWLPCTDGKARPTQPGIFPLVDGLSFRLGCGSAFEGKSRVGMLRAAGNAIVPSLAAQFVLAFLDGKQAYANAPDLGQWET